MAVAWEAELGVTYTMLCVCVLQCATFIPHWSHLNVLLKQADGWTRVQGCWTNIQTDPAASTSTVLEPSSVFGSNMKSFVSL